MASRHDLAVASVVNILSLNISSTTIYQSGSASSCAVVLVAGVGMDITISLYLATTRHVLRDNSFHCRGSAKTKAQAICGHEVSAEAKQC